MKIPVKDLIEHTPVRARVAFVLRIADQVLCEFKHNPQVYLLCQKAIQHGWEWEETMSVPAEHLYQHIDPIALLESDSLDKHESSVLCTIATAIWYVTWRAYTLEVRTGKITQNDIPSDMFEGGEYVIEEICQYAIETQTYNEELFLTDARRLLEDFKTDQPKELGQVINREYFTSL